MNKQLLVRLMGLYRRLVFPYKRLAKEDWETFTQVEFTTTSFRNMSTLKLLDKFVRGCSLQKIDQMWRNHYMWGGKEEGQYDHFDMIVLSGMTRYFGLKKIVECSPYKGWSTTLIQLASAPDSVHISFDIENHESKIKETMARNGATGNWRLIVGDFRQTAPQFSEFISEADLIFIDSDHRLDFARWYLEEFDIFSRVKDEAIIHIHDIYPLGREPDHYGESRFVLEWLQKHKDNFDIFWTYELSRLPEVMHLLPKNYFLDHSGKQAANPSLWLTKRIRQ